MPPEQLDWCERCNAPIYMESLAGACTCPEGALRALQLDIAKRQARRAHVVSTPRHAQDLGAILMGEARRDLGLQEEFEHFDLRGHTERDIPAPSINRPGFNLESLWTGEGIEDAFGPVVNTADEIFPIEFDEIPMDAGPRPTGDREATRFRVDRGTPQREPFRGNLEAGPQGGPMREVGTVRGFAVLREQRLAGLRPGERYATSEPEYVGNFRPAQEPRVAPKPSPTPPAKRLTAFERIKKGFLDDD